MLEAQKREGLSVTTTTSLAATSLAATSLPGPLQRLLGRVGANGLLTGTALFFVSTTIVNGGNYLFNLVLGRWLGPALFADVSIIITLFLFLTFITAGFQQTAAKFAAIYSAQGDQTQLFALRQWLNQRSWLIGGGCLLLMGGGALFWQQFFHTQSAWIFVIFAFGLPVYFVQGIDRGLLQGQTRFGILAITYQVEMWVRLSIGLLLVAFGWGAAGAVWGLTLSLLATWSISHWALQTQRKASTTAPTLSIASTSGLSPAQQQAILHFALPVLLAETSLILINNSDVLIVKRFFDSVSAGQYAALALIGRIVFFATWSVVITMFPLVAQKQQRGEAHRPLLWTSLGMVLGVSVLIVATTALLPELIIQLLFGADYLGIAPLLWRYAVATALFALANVLINYRLALGNRAGTLFALVAGIAQVATLITFHASLAQVVNLQIWLMAGLLFLLLGWEVIVQRQAGTSS